LTLDNVNIVSTGRAGILAGEIDGTGNSLSNITIKNSSVSGNSSNGVGVFIGYSTPGFASTINNITILNSTALNANQAAGVIFGLIVVLLLLPTYT